MVAARLGASSPSCRPAARPVCRTRCNIKPVCGGNQWSYGGGNSFSCGNGNSGYNPGYGYNPAINIQQVMEESMFLLLILQGIDCHP